MKFRDYISLVLNETEEIPVNTQLDDKVVEKADSVEDIGAVESGADAEVPVEDVPKDAVNVDTAESEPAKFTIDGPSTIDEAVAKYKSKYTDRLIQAAAKTGGIGKGKFYTLGITSLRAGKLGNAEIRHIEGGKEVETTLTKKEKKESKKNAFLLVSQCRVIEIGIMEGFYKKFVIGARIRLTGDAKKKKIGEWLTKANSKLESEKKKFKHIQTDTQAFDKALGEDEFAVPVHWIPRLREVIETEISRKHMDDAKKANKAKEAGEDYESPKTLHVKKGYEARIKVPGRDAIKLPEIGKR